jgi:hypothetical protein
MVDSPHQGFIWQTAQAGARRAIAPGGPPLRVCRQPPSALSPDAYRKRANRLPVMRLPASTAERAKFPLFNTWTHSPRTSPHAARSRSKPAKLRLIP